MDPRCDIHWFTKCFCASDAALADLRRKLTGMTKDEALRALADAVTAARQAGLDVECKVTEKVETIL